MAGDNPGDLCDRCAEIIGEELTDHEQDTDPEDDQAGQNDFEASMGWGRE